MARGKEMRKRARGSCICDSQAEKRNLNGDCILCHDREERSTAQIGNIKKILPSE